MAAVSIAELLHSLWAANATLNALLPASRVFTGRVPRDTAMPFASIVQPAGVSSGQSNLHRHRQDTWRVQVWCEGGQQATGERIQRAVEDCFANYSGAMDVGAVVSIMHDSSFHLQEEEPGQTVWQFVTQFTVTVERPRVL